MHGRGRHRAGTAGHGLEALDLYFAKYLPQLVSTAIATPVIVVVMWWQDWPSGLTAVITLPLIPLFMSLIGVATRTVQRGVPVAWRNVVAVPHVTRFSLDAPAAGHGHGHGH